MERLVTRSQVENEFEEAERTSFFFLSLHANRNQREERGLMVYKEKRRPTSSEDVKEKKGKYRKGKQTKQNEKKPWSKNI